MCIKNKTMMCVNTGGGGGGGGGGWWIASCSGPWSTRLGGGGAGEGLDGQRSG